MLDDKSVFGLLRKETLALKKQFAKPRYTRHCISLHSAIVYSLCAIATFTRYAEASLILIALHK